MEIKEMGRKLGSPLEMLAAEQELQNGVEGDQ